MFHSILNEGGYKEESEGGRNFLTLDRADLRCLPSQKSTPGSLNGRSMIMFYFTLIGRAVEPLEWDYKFSSSIFVFPGKKLLATESDMAPIKLTSVFHL